MNLKLIKAASVFALAAFVSFITGPHMDDAMRKILFIFIVGACFWAFEIIPLFATSMIVILLEVFLLGLSHSSLSYIKILSLFGSPILILFFGGFILAHALNKYSLDRLIASKLLRIFGHKPYFILIGFMITTAILSMWMSDTATTAMMIAMLLPCLKQLEDEDPFRTALILSIPFSALIGGMATPVGTPPNAIAIGILADHGINVEFFSWMKMALPLSAILLYIASIVLYLFFPPQSKQMNIQLDYKFIKNGNSLNVASIALMTIFLWLTSGVHHIPSAVIALLSAGLFSVTGLINKDDLKAINWDVLILMWGGLALGKGMEATGFADYVVSLPFFNATGIILVIMFAVLGLVLSSFMSNTATATLIIPIAIAIPTENSIILAVVIALSCSLAMVLPVSTPPNAIAFSTDMLKAGDMIKAGLVISIISVIIIILGHKMMIVQYLKV